MKNSRAKKLDRMVSLMTLQLRLSEWQLARLRQKEQELQDEDVYLVGTLNDEEPPAGSSTESISRRLAATSVGVRAVRTEASSQLARVEADGRRVKQLERAAKAATEDELRDAERRSLEELTAIRPAASEWKSRTK
jgi:hypothetical protein